MVINGAIRRALFLSLVGFDGTDEVKVVESISFRLRWLFVDACLLGMLAYANQPFKQ